MKSNLAQEAIPYNDSDFLPDDVVVLKDLNLLFVGDLITLKSFDGVFWKTNHRIGRVSEQVIRTATVAELQANRRLSQTEQALAEVS